MPIINIRQWWMQSAYTHMAGSMRNFIPNHMVHYTGQVMRVNIDDGDIYLCECASKAIDSIRTNIATIGNYPGIEARIYGEGCIHISFACKLAQVTEGVQAVQRYCQQVRNPQVT